MEEAGDVLERLPMAAFLQGPTSTVDWRHRRRGEVLLVGVTGSKVGDGHCWWWKVGGGAGRGGLKE